MFGIDFYPTPTEVINDMLNGYDVENKSILEPSAGKGNIIEILLQSNAKQVLYCEIDNNLSLMCQDKGGIFLNNDFLQTTKEQVSHIDFIIMNPPFSKQKEHIMHAWKIAPEGCSVLSLCNSDMFKGYGSRSLEILNIINEYGDKVDLGNCFKNAERYTDVYITLIKLKKPIVNEGKNEFEGFFMDDDVQKDEGEGLLPYNFIKDIVGRYVKTIGLFDKQLETAIEINESTSLFYDLKIGFSCKSENKIVTRNEFAKDLQKNAWKFIFNKMNLTKVSTSGLREDINKFVEHNSNIPFTMKNIYRMIDIVIGTTSQRMDKALMEVFTNVTRHYDENRYNVEGWKTNSHYLLTEKFILPYVVERGFRNGEPDLRYREGDKLEDMQKAICYMTGTKYEDATPLYDYFRNNYIEWGKWNTWGFFEIKCFKKGTMHFKFKSVDLWAKFNQNISRIMGYPLPENIKWS